MKNNEVTRRTFLRASAATGALMAIPVVSAQNTPYVNESVDGWNVTLEFVNPTNFLFAFDYQVDGEPEGTEDQWTGQTISQGPLEGQDFGLRYNGVTVQPNSSETVTVQSTEEVRYRLARGAEQNWYIDWQTVYPEQPESRGDCMGGSHENYGFRNQGQCIRYVNTGQDSR